MTKFIDLQKVADVNEEVDKELLNLWLDSSHYVSKIDHFIHVNFLESRWSSLSPDQKSKFHTLQLDATPIMKRLLGFIPEDMYGEEDE